jgi:subtilisin-like proprotein convertase family protein
MANIQTLTNELIRGDTWPWTINVTDSSTSNAIDISSYKLYFTIKQSLSDSDDDAVYTKDITAHTDGENGTSEFTMTPDSTITISVNGSSYKIPVKAV